MNKRIIKGITALALTAALCPTVPTLAAQEDWKDIYFDFIKSTLKQKDIYENMAGIQLSDLNLDGIPELIMRDWGAVAAYGANIFEIINSQVELRYGIYYNQHGNFNRNYMDSEKSLWILPYGDNTLKLNKNRYTDELMYTLSSSNTDGYTGYIVTMLYYFSDDIITANEIFYSEIEDGGTIYSPDSKFRIGNNEVSGVEYETAYNEFISTWQDTGYQIAYRDINYDKMTDSDIKNFLNSYIPERKALGLDISVTVNGSDIAFDQPPVIVNDRTLVPLRAVFEALGATVDWNGDTRTVTSKLGKTTVTLAIGSNTMKKNGETITLDVPAQLVGDRTLVPVRAVAEAFGAKVDWEQETHTVRINK